MKKIAAVIAIHGREPIALKTVLRLREQSYPVQDIVLVGNTAREEALATVTKSNFVRHENQPLGKKWQAGMEYARGLNPDAILIIGSDDWLSNNWCERMMREIEAGYDLVGKGELFFLNVGDSHNEVVHWRGYDDPARDNEPIGAGRLISRKLLDALQWNWFPQPLNGGLDGVTYQITRRVGGRVKLVQDETCYVADIKSSLWENMWSIEEYKAMKQTVIIGSPDRWLDTHFPDARSFFDMLRKEYENFQSPR